MRDRRTIMDTAISLFQQKGYEEVTVSEICKACDIAYGTFFNQFKTKGNLLWEYVFGHLTSDQSFLEAMEERSALGKLMALVKPVSLVPEKISAPLLKQFLTLRMHQLEYWQKYDSLFVSRIKTYCALIQQAQQDGEIRNRSNPEDILRAMRDMMLSTQISWAVDPSFDFEQRFASRLETMMDVRPDLRRYTTVSQDE